MSLSPSAPVSEYTTKLSLFPEGAYHVYDYQFFFRNLQENVGVRIESYFAEAALDKAA